MALMARPLALLLALLGAAPAAALGPIEPPGRLPPVAPSPPPDDPGRPPRKATPVVPPAGPLPRGAILEQLSGVVGAVDRRTHHVTIDPPSGEPVTLAMDRNTMVYTSAGLGTVLDVTPGAHVRAGRNADFVAYWIQVRPALGKGTAVPPPTPDQGTGPAGGGAAPAGEPRGGTPGASGPAAPGTPGPGSPAGAPAR